MDRGEFAASISEEQEEFIDNRIEGFLTLMNTCIMSTRIIQVQRPSDE